VILLDMATSDKDKLIAELVAEPYKLPGGPARILAGAIITRWGTKQIGGPTEAPQQGTKFASYEALIAHYVVADWKPKPLLDTPTRSSTVEKVGQYFSVKNQEISRAILVQAICDQFSKWIDRGECTTDDFRRNLCTILIGGAPGIGKTTFACKSLF